MKVLKFGGTSVGSALPLANVKEIVSSTQGPAVVGVSALGGITDALIRTASIAEAADPSWKTEFEAIRSRHWQLVSELMPQGFSSKAELEQMFQRLHELYRGGYLIRALGPNPSAGIVRYDERIPSRIVS